MIAPRQFKRPSVTRSTRSPGSASGICRTASTISLGVDAVARRAREPLPIRAGYTTVEVQIPKDDDKESSKMPNRLIGAILIVALASSPIAFAQTGRGGTQGGRGGTASSKPFDPHDLSGFWDITNIGLPAGALNSTSNNRPQMTPSGVEVFRKTKTGDATALSNGSSPNDKEWNDPIRWCDPTGFPRIMWNPT